MENMNYNGYGTEDWPDDKPRILPKGFKTTNNTEEKDGKEQIEYMEPGDLLTFRNHTFQVKDDEEMIQLRESIRKNGILVPLLIFRNEDGELELISGHRRTKAALDIGLEKVPVIIKKVTRDMATILMGESNLRTREKLLPSERAFTYKAMLDALRRTPGRVRAGEQAEGRSRERLAEGVGQSGRQIQKYICLTRLIPELLRLVDEGKIALKPAEALSRLSYDSQRAVFSYYLEHEVTPSYSQAVKMAKLDAENLLQKKEIYEMLEEPKGNQVYRDPKLMFRSRMVAELLKNIEFTTQREERVILGLRLLSWYEDYLIKIGTDPKLVTRMIWNMISVPYKME